MNRYIDADKLIKVVEHWKPYVAKESIIKALKSCKTADVVEVVRCKDCRHKDECNQYVLRNGDECELAFCSHGERREE